MVIARIVNDKVIFQAFELLFILFTCVAFYKDLKIYYIIYRIKHGTYTYNGEFAHLSVVPGPESRNYFWATWVFLSVIFSQIIQITEALKGYKTVILIFDLVLLFYLCFYNSWFKNYMLIIISRWQKMPY